VSQQTTNHSFDELTRGLASGSISRGRALRLMGAALVGGTLTSLGLGGVAAADPPGCKRNGKKLRGTTSAVAATALAAPALLRVDRSANPALPTFSAAAATARVVYANLDNY
jgi:hypothetical protein